MRAVLAVLLGVMVGVGLGQLPDVKAPTAPVAAARGAMTISVMTRARPEGHRLAYDDLTQREVPGDVVSASHITPVDAARLVGSVLREPVDVGDALTWSHVRRGPWGDAVASCVARVSPEVAKQSNAAMVAAAAQFTPLSPETVAAEALPVPEEVLVVVGSLKAGETIRGSHLRVTRAPPGLTTRSWVPAAALRDVRGAQVLVPLAEGDALLWQAIDSNKVPMSVLACAAAVDRAGADAQVQAAKRLLEKKP
jgi:Flp pilus assembly protein CpaB